MPMTTTTRGISCAVFLWLLLSTAVAGTVSTNSWRPYRSPHTLVTTGMSKIEVGAKAGSPERSQVVALGTDGSPTESVWSYVRKGSNAEITNLTFRGNELVKIEVSPLD